MRYSKAITLIEGNEVILKRTNKQFKVSYIEKTVNPDNEDKHCWVHVTEKNDSGCSIFHHKELK